MAFASRTALCREHCELCSTLAAPSVTGTFRAASSSCGTASRRSTRCITASSASSARSTRSCSRRRERPTPEQTRMRALCGEKHCPVCQEDLQQVVFCDSIKPFGRVIMRALKSLPGDRKYGVRFKAGPPPLI